jgi:tellurite methyltransferase
LPFEDARFDAVVCIAVLHFAKDAQLFDTMVQELWRVLKPGGMLLVRTASSTGVEDQISECGSGWYHLPDGSDRYLVSDARLQALTKLLDANLLEPLKSTIVHGKRSMTTWCLGKKEITS